MDVGSLKRVDQHFFISEYRNWRKVAFGLSNVKVQRQNVRGIIEEALLRF